MLVAIQSMMSIDTANRERERSSAWMGLGLT